MTALGDPVLSRAPFRNAEIRPYWGMSLYADGPKELLQEQFDEATVTNTYVLQATYQITYDSGAGKAWKYLNKFARSIAPCHMPYLLVISPRLP